MIKRRKRALLLLGFSLAAQQPMLGLAAENAQKTAPPAKSPHPDVKFLEYLGTVEDDEDNWMDVELGATETKPSASAPVSKSGAAGKEPTRTVEKK